MITLYLRKEPTTDSVLLDAVRRFNISLTEAHKDVVGYMDKECKAAIARFPWHHTGKPTRRNKYIMLNCYRYRVEWID